MPSTDKPRNPHSIPAKKRKAGKMRPRQDKRKNGKNQQRELIKEAENT